MDRLERKELGTLSFLYRDAEDTLGRMVQRALDELKEYRNLADEGRLIEIHQAAVILAEAFGYEHPCSFNGNDEWFSEVCDLGDLCPDGKMSAIACWEQYIKVKLAELKGGGCDGL